MIYELFSERKRRAAQSGQADVYQYDSVPDKLRVQVQQILRDAIGPQYHLSSYDMYTPNHNPDTWEFIHKTLCREMGVHSLGGSDLEADQVIQFIATARIDQFLDAVELCVRVVDRLIRKWPDHVRKSHGITQTSDDALGEINHRFRQSGLGYQFEEGQAIRVDAAFTHDEVVKPALRLLSTDGYEGAQEEFLSAHRHYRNGDYEEAITEAAKSFESALKITCDMNGWAYAKGARASDLLKRVRAEGLWPDYLDASFDQLIATLSSGLPRVRNEEGAHGQGATLRTTPPYVAAYALHLAAAKILLISEAARARKS